MNLNHVDDLIRAAKPTLTSPGVAFRDQQIRRNLSLATVAAELDGLGQQTPTENEDRLHQQLAALRDDLAGVLLERDELRNQLDEQACKVEDLKAENAKLLNAIRRLTHPAADDQDLSDAQQLLEDIGLGHREEAAA